MHVIVVGCGRVGSELSASLEVEGHSVAVIDKASSAFRRLPPSFAGRMIEGYGFDRETLHSAGIERASALAAVTNGDNSNIVTARVARESFGIEHVVARIYDPRRAAIFQRLGIPTVATVAWTTDQVRRRLLPEEHYSEWLDATGKVALVELAIPSSWAGTKLAALNEPGAWWLTTISRLGQARVTTDNLVVQEGDIGHFVVEVEALERLRERLAGREAGPLMRVAIAGGGNVGSFIARELRDAGHTVVVLEQNESVVLRRRSTDLGIEWRVADACEFRSLEAAELATCDVVIAATGDDEDNLVVSLLSRQEFAVPRIVARVNNPQNEWLFNETWGVDVAVSTPHLLTALVEEAVSVGSLVRLLRLEGGRVVLVEVTLDSGSPVNGFALKDLQLPRDATIVAIVREQHVVVPRGDTVLAEGDEVMLLTAPEVEGDVRQLLTSP